MITTFDNEAVAVVETNGLIQFKENFGDGYTGQTLTAMTKEEARRIAMAILDCTAEDNE